MKCLETKTVKVADSKEELRGKRHSKWKLLELQRKWPSFLQRELRHIRQADIPCI
jgi:hypothetical protein